MNKIPLSLWILIITTTKQNGSYTLIITLLTQNAICQIKNKIVSKHTGIQNSNNKHFHDEIVNLIIAFHKIIMWSFTRFMLSLAPLQYKSILRIKNK